MLSNLDGALSNSETATVQYALDKAQKDMWNFIVGVQFQLNRNWMIRGEYGFLGSRQQFIGGLQFRFGI
jgi:opacity protein-like surface antigen